MDEKAAIGALRQIKEAFDEHGIEFWLDYGTLLGAIRDKKFIEWDNDIDLSTWDNNIEELETVAKKLYTKGFDTNLLHDRFVIDYEKLHVDVYFYRLDDSGSVATTDNLRIFSFFGRILYYLILRGLSVIYSSPKKTLKNKIIRIIHFILMNLPHKSKKSLYRITYLLFRKSGSFYFRKVIPSSYFTKLSTTIFYGMKFKVPSRTKEYLKYIYGESWEVPTKYWAKNEEQPKLWQSRRGTFGKVQVVCPKCNHSYIIKNPHSGNEKNLVKRINIKCEECNYEWTESIFILGTILRQNNFDGRI